MTIKVSKKFKNLIDFVQFTHEFRTVIRIARAPNDPRMENDAEHSYQLAMVAWFIIDQNKLRLNKELCFMYALAHDLIEIYAGDTFPYDKAAVKTKAKREKDALKKIMKRFPNFKALSSIITKYEQRKDAESTLVYAIDKLLPPLQCYLDKGALWHKHKISFDQMVGSKRKKIALSKDVNAYWQELLAGLSKNKNKFFPS